MQQLQTSLDPDTTLATVSDLLPNLKQQIDDRTTEDRRLLDTAASLNLLQSSQTTWQGLSDSLAVSQKSISVRVGKLDGLLGDLNQMDVMWAATQNAATKAKAPPEILQSIKDVIALIASTNKVVLAHLVPLYAMQNQIAAQDKLSQAGIAAIKKAIDAGWTELFQRNHPPLWDPLSFAHPNTGVITEEKASLGTQYSETQAYLEAKTGAVLIHLLLFTLLIIGLYWIRNIMQAQCRDQPALKNAAEIFSRPFATALMLALLASWFLYPDAPRFLLAFLGAITLIPAVIVTRRLIDPTNFPILYAAVIAYFVDQVRYVVTPAGIVSRFLFIFELLAVVIFILVVFRSKHLCSTSADPNRLKHFTRLYLHLTYFVLLFAGFANVFGYIPLSIQAGNGMLVSSYLAVILYAAVRIADAFAISALSMPPFSRLGMVRRHLDLIYGNTTTLIRWIILGLWVFGRDAGLRRLRSAGRLAGKRA